MLRRLLFPLLVLTLMAGCSNSRTEGWARKHGFARHEVFPVTVGEYGFPYVAARVKGQPLTMLFDTGNMVGVTVSSTVSRQLGLTPASQWQSRDSAGNLTGTYSIFSPEPIEAFGMRYTASLFAGDDDRFASVLTPHLLVDRRFTLDYRNRLMGVSSSQLPDFPGQEVFPLIRNAQHVQMSAMPVIRGLVNGVEVLIQLDTGKSRTCVDPLLVAQLSLPESSNGHRIGSIKLGNFELKVTNAKAVSLKGISAGYPGPIMLGIGSDLISQFVLTVDYPRDR